MKTIKKIVCFSFLLILPVGYNMDTKDSTHFTVGAGVGYGNYAKLVEGCEGGQEVSMVKFRDFGGSVAFHPTVHTPFVLGFRGGYLSVEEAPVAKGEPEYFRTSHHPYINPNLSFEFKTVGIGLGWFRNLGSVFPDDGYNIQPFDFRRSKDFPSGHLRLGKTDSWFALASFCEGVPAMTQYGTILGGIGYGGLESKTIIGGICGGLHEHAGLFAGMISRPGRWGGEIISLRIGRNYDTFEGSFSLGWYFPIK